VSSSLDLSFRPLRRDDFDLLGDWLSRPHVSQWWRDPYDPASLEARYGAAIGGRDPTEVFIIELGGAPIGLIQRYDTDDNPEWQRTLGAAGVWDRSIGIDYLIGVEDLIGKGIGPAAIDRFVVDTWLRYVDVSVITVAIQQANTRSWRAIEKGGFVRVWSGLLASEDPSDHGPSHIYQRHRPGSARAEDQLSGNAPQPR
jgi:aminoglycoside 6'-N-acetyltransferase